MRYFAVCLLTIACIAGGAHLSAAQQIRPASTVTRGLESKHNTIAHQILAMEAAVSDVSPDMFKLLDTFIDDAVRRINLPENYNRSDVVKALTEIDKLLTERNVVYPADQTKMGLVSQLSDGLRGRVLNQDEIQAVANNRHNVRRRNQIISRSGQTFFINDCDTTTYIYLGIADVIGFPLYMVELPGHNFVRFENDFFGVDWETMDGIEIPPGKYEGIWNISDRLVRDRIYMASMSRLDLVGYQYSITGADWGLKKFDQRAADDLNKAVNLYQRSPRVWNNLAWSLVVSSDPKQRNGPKAVEYATKAISLSRTPNLMDTLACAHAEVEKFSLAISTEEDARTLYQSRDYPRERDVPDFGSQIARFKAQRTCADQLSVALVSTATLKAAEPDSLRQTKYSLNHQSHLITN